MQLPAALKPWREWLDWFSDDLSATMGEMLLRLQALISQQQKIRGTDSTSFAGLDTLKSRGSYERLLLSEWALADEFPDEFTRRATAGEHLFLSPSEQTDSGVKIIIALFDAGPLQQGAPRLAHLALWVLLHRRATVLGAVFYWGIIQNPGELSSEHGASALNTLLRARCFIPVEAAHYQQWQLWLEKQNFSKAECWNVSHDHHVLTFLPTAHRLTVRRELGKRTLSVTLAAGTKSSVAELPIPKNELAMRLLRGEFVTRANEKTHLSTKHNFSLQQPPLFSADGRHIAVALLQPSVLIYRVPETPDQKPRSPTINTWSSQQQMVSGIQNGKRFAAILLDGEKLTFWQLPGFGSTRRAENDIWKITPGTAQWRAGFFLQRQKDPGIYLLDSANTLLLWTKSAQRSSTHASPSIIQKNVIAAAQVESNFLIFAYYQGQNTIAISSEGTDRTTPYYVLPYKEMPTRILFGGGQAWRNGRGQWAVNVSTEQHKITGNQRWLMYQGDGQSPNFSSEEIVINIAYKIMGIVKDTFEDRQQISLIASAPNGRDILLISPSHQEVLLTLPSKLANITVNAGSRHVAIVTQERQLFIYSVAHRTLLLSSQSMESVPNG